MEFILIAGIYLALIPSILLCIGATRKTWARSHRITRLQLEGAALLLICLVSRLLVFGPHIGLNIEREGSFAFWFGRGEQGLFLIGLILFWLGFFLERRPRPDLEPWPRPYTQAAGLCLGVCAVIGVVLLWRQYSPGPMPWGLARMWFLLGLSIFSFVYCRRAFWRPDESIHAESNLLDLEE